MQPIEATAALHIGDADAEIVIPKEPGKSAVGFVTPTLIACDIKCCPARVDRGRCFERLLVK